jgi:hypothetical protein
VRKAAVRARVYSTPSNADDPADDEDLSGPSGAAKRRHGKGKSSSLHPARGETACESECVANDGETFLSTTHDACGDEVDDAEQRFQKLIETAATILKSRRPRQHHAFRRTRDSLQRIASYPGIPMIQGMVEAVLQKLENT